MQFLTKADSKGMGNLKVELYFSFLQDPLLALAQKPAFNKCSGSLCKNVMCEKPPL